MCINYNKVLYENYNKWLGDLLPIIGQKTRIGGNKKNLTNLFIFIKNIFW
jgi:hypothetical protein